MQIKIEAETPNWAMTHILSAVANALRQKETAELLQAFPMGENFKMVDDRKGITITITKF